MRREGEGETVQARGQREKQRVSREKAALPQGGGGER